MGTFCSNCESSLTADVNFCPKCGKPTSSYYSGSGVSSNDPTALASPFKNPLQIPSSEYGSNPYGAPTLNPYEVTPLIPPPPPPQRRNKMLGILIGINLLVLILAGVGVFALLSQRAKDHATTASTPSVPHGTLLYAADWTSGLNGWRGSADWKVINGILTSDGSYQDANYGSHVSPTIEPPYQATGTSDYAVEVRIQQIGGQGCLDAAVIRGSVATDGVQGYRLAIGCLGGATLYAAHGSTFYSIAHEDFNPGNNWHTYRLEAQGTTISAFIDGIRVLEANDNRYLSGGYIGIKSQATQINVSSFKVFAL
jgi:hypothetical protein